MRRVLSARAIRESESMWLEVEALASMHRLPDRAMAPLLDAAIGLRVRNAGYTVEQSCDASGKRRSRTKSPPSICAIWRNMVSAGLLERHGTKRGTYYVGSPVLRGIRHRVQQSRQPIDTAALFKPAV